MRKCNFQILKIGAILLPLLLLAVLEWVEVEKVVAGGSVEFVLECVTVLMTMAAVVAAFSKRQDGVWRWMLLEVSMLLGVIAYELTLKSTGLLCAAIAMLVLLWRFSTTSPKEEK